jgi:ABC-type multidrug transport system fused ATPase/permease subunit
VALARALLREAPLLLLDEPTQHLDADSADHVTRSLAELQRGRTVVQVAHHLAVARQADHVVVLAHGRVVESGQPGSLATAGGAYQRLLAAEGMA